MDSFGYGSGDPNTEVGIPQAQLRALRMANQNNLYNIRAGISADQGLANPQTAAALAALSQQSGQQAPPATAPFPGQPSTPQGGGGGQPMPPVMPVTQNPQVPMSQLQQPTSGGPGLSVMPSGPVPPPPSPSQIPNNPFASGQPQPMPQQAPQQNNAQNIMSQYPTPAALIGAIQQANPDMSPAGLSQLIQRVLPMYQNRQGSSDPYKMLLEQQRLGIGAGQPDPQQVDNAVAQIKSTGNFAILSRMPAPFREAVIAKLDGFDSGSAQVDLTGRKAQASSEGRQTGQLNVAGEGFAAIMPDAFAASAKVPRESWKFANQVSNWMKEQSNDPDFAAFQNYNLGLVREYARAMGGTVSAQTKAESALGTAKNEAAYDAAVKALYREIQDAKKGGQRALSKTSGKLPEDNMGEPDSIQLPGSAPGGDNAASDPLGIF